MAGVHNTIGEITQPAKIRVTVMNGRHKMIISRTVFVMRLQYCIDELHFVIPYPLRHCNGFKQSGWLTQR